MFLPLLYFYPFKIFHKNEKRKKSKKLTISNSTLENKSSYSNTYLKCNFLNVVRPKLKVCKIMSINVK